MEAFTHENKMPLVPAHGRAAELGAVDAVETSKIENLPLGRPAIPSGVPSESDLIQAEIQGVEAELASLPDDAPKATRFVLWGKIGGLKKQLNAAREREQAEAVARLTEVGSTVLPESYEVADSCFQALLPEAWEFFRHEAEAMSRDLAAGTLPRSAMSFLESGVLAWAASRAEYAKGRFKEAAALAEASSAMLIRSHEYAAKRGASVTPEVGSFDPKRAVELVRKAFGEHARPAGEAAWLESGGIGAFVTTKGDAISNEPGQAEREPVRVAPEPARNAPVRERARVERAAQQAEPAPQQREAPEPWEIIESRRFYQNGGYYGIGAGDPRFLVSADDRAKHETRQFAQDLADAIQDAIDSGALPKI